MRPNRFAPTMKLHLIKEQAGLRPGKSFTSQLLNIIQNIPDGYLEKSDRALIRAIHLRHRETKRPLKLSWNGVDLENTAQPKYLGVTFDRTLSYK